MILFFLIKEVLAMALSFLGKDWHSILEDRLSLNGWLRKLSISIGQDCLAKFEKLCVCL